MVKFIIPVLFAFLVVSLNPNVSFADEEVKLIVKYKEGVSLKSSKRVSADTSIPIDAISVDKQKVNSTIRSMKSNPAIEYIEVDHKVYGQATIPNDEKYVNQKEMFDSIHAAAAWEQYDAKRQITVAVIDSGADLDHPDLESNLVNGKNIINPDEYPVDLDGHGTHVAGLIGAVTDNQVGVASLAKGVKLMPIKVLEDNEGYTSDVILGINYAVEHGADIINLSLGSNDSSKSLKEAVEFAVENDVLVVAAAGNKNANNVIYPAAYDPVLAVGSVDTGTNQKASFSNYGSFIDVAAPGTNLLSTWMDGGYKQMEGTSMSTGIVSSLAGMLMKDAPYLSSMQVMEIIKKSSSAIDGEYDLGNGVINALQAFEQVKTNNRLHGATSIDTAIEISQYGWNNLSTKSIKLNEDDVTGKFVIVATANQFPDSLSAAPLATYLDSPILLVNRDYLSDNLVNELNRLSPSDVIIIGGESAVSNQLEGEIDTIGYTTHRLQGANRYETSIAVNEAIPYESNKAFVVSGEKFPDALSAAPYSGIYKYPILYTRQDTLPETVSNYIENQGITKSYLVGGETAISNIVENKLPAPLRIAGINRYDTNYQIHKFFGESETNSLYFSTGSTFPDALAVAPLAAKTSSPVILVDNRHEEALQNSIQLFSSENYKITGGTEAISIELAWKIDSYLIN
ncbi:cell wall-binding repeat-containing protein [Virgibacillus flavescens]|uniref:cell wall-binding repeat-containing protein n=1 Tax=Virgibacillus flavescens TaxID=1611422 RepID=UPI003D351231